MEVPSGSAYTIVYAISKINQMFHIIKQQCTVPCNMYSYANMQNEAIGDHFRYPFEGCTDAGGSTRIAFVIEPASSRGFCSALTSSFGSMEIPTR